MTDNGVRQPLPDHGQTDTLAEKGEKRGLGNGADHLENHDDESRYLKGNPFGDEKEGETDTVKYVTMSWWHCGIIMVAETIALGILSLPSVVARLGLAPACILIIGLGLLATYTGYNLGQFKLRYPHVHSMADAGEVLMGPIGREVLGAAQLLFLTFISGSHVLTFGIMLNTLSNHGACTIVFNVIGLIVCFLFTLPRTLLKVSWLSLASFISLIAALLITMIAIGIEHPGKGVEATKVVDFVTAFGAVTNIIFAYAGHVAFFGFISEMKRPQDYDKALYLLQSLDTSLYLVAAVVIYYYAGDDVASPALGTTSLTVAKVAYGIAIPTIVIAGIINAHVAAKQIYVRIFRGTRRMGERSFVSVGVWVLIIGVIWIIAWIIAEAIPVFNNLLGLIVALFASWFTYGLSGVFWLHLNWGQLFSSPRKIFLTIINLIVVAIGAAIMALGLWVSGVAIHADTGHRPFSCDNTAAQRG